MVSAVRRYFCSNRGLLRAVVWHAVAISGGLSGYRNVSLEGVERLVFVCHGNLYRSALAEQVARSFCVACVSCGVQTRAGSPAEDRGIIAADRLGFSLREHRSVPIRDVVSKESDLVLLFDPSHAPLVRSFFGEGIQIAYVGRWIPRWGPYIADPFCGSDEYLDFCFGLIFSGVRNLCLALKNS